MNDKPEIIRKIEEKFGFPLTLVKHKEIQKKTFDTQLGYNLSYKNSPLYPYKGSRSYSVNDGIVIGLSLDYCPAFLISPDEFRVLKYLEFLSLKNSFIPDYAFIKNLINLTSLDLSFNNLSDASFLKEIKGLISLNLSFNDLRDVSFINELKGLFYLDLSNNEYLGEVSVIKDLISLKTLNLSNSNLRNVTFIKDLHRLTALTLSGNPSIKDLFFIKEMKGLTYLDLSNVELDDFLFITELKRLKTLYLGNNNLSGVAYIKELKELTTLDLSKNSYLSGIADIKELKWLTCLYLSHNKLTDYSFIKKLNGLTSLDLSHNNLTDVSFIKDLKNLTSLFLTDNNLREVSFIQNLKSLISLDLSNNYFLSDVSFISRLKQLKFLGLRNNYYLTDVTFLKELKGLSFLDLGNNRVNDISLIKELKKLTFLDLKNNNLSDISFIQGLRNLISLDLSSNNLRDTSILKNFKRIVGLDLSNNYLLDISFIEELSMILFIDLRNNQIKSLPVWISEMDIDIFSDITKGGYGRILIKNNPIESPPIETVKQGKEAIHNYFRQIGEQGYDYLFEAKMLVLGEGGSGKTSLVRRLIDRSSELPKEEETTRGIDITPIYFNISLKDWKFQHKKFRLNIWDFGGQQIYHATHRFFLTHRAMYLLVADTREGGTDFNYWFQYIEKFGGDSPVLPVINEKFNRTMAIENFNQMRDRFTNVKDKIPVNILENRNLDSVNYQIELLSNNLPHIGSKIPAKWTVLREILEKDERNYISQSEYFEICKDKGISEVDAIYISGFFHNLGIFLHYQENDFLKKTVFLKPQWVTNAVFRMVDNPFIQHNKGEFSRSDVNEIWNDADFHPVRGELLEMMKNFLLIYQINGTDCYVMPQHLGEHQPDYESFENDCKKITYKYDEFMPRGILHQLIVSMHDKIARHDWVWYSGVIFFYHETEAEVLESYTKKTISIRIKGAFPRDLMMILIDQLDKINNSYAKLKVDKYLPCNCQKCIESSTPNEYPFEILMKFIKDRQPEIMCNESYKMVLVESLIGEVLERWRIRQGILYSDSEISDQTIIDITQQSIPTIFFSYASGDESKTPENQEKIVEELYDSLSSEDYKLKRDKTDLEFGESITDFMKEIGQGKLILVFISEKYLRSEFCMYELYEIFRNSKLEKGEFQKHVLLFHSENVQLKKAATVKKYLQYWSDLEKEWKEVADFPNAAKSQREKYDKIRNISLEFGNLVEFITDINASQKEILSNNDFEIVKIAIRKRLSG
jgi:internalin A